MKSTLGLWVSLAWLLTTGMTRAADVEITIPGGGSTFTTNVVFTVAHLGEGKTILLKPANCYHFPAAPTMTTNGIVTVNSTVTQCSASYQILLTGGLQATVTISGSIAPGTLCCTTSTGGGGGGPPPAGNAFTVNVLARRPWIKFTTPMGGTNLTCCAGTTNTLETVVVLGNSGVPSSGTVAFSAAAPTLGLFQPVSVALAAGGAATAFIATTNGGSGTITATANDIPNDLGSTISGIATNLAAQVIAVTALTASEGSNPNGPTNIVCWSSNGTVAVTATLNPAITANFPACYQFTGGVTSNDLIHTITKTNAALTTFIAKAGTSAKTNVIAVLKIDFTKVGNCSGFDDSVDPPWLMVPKSGNNTANAVIAPAANAALVQFISGNASIATVSPASASALPKSSLSQASPKVKPMFTQGQRLCKTLDISVKEKKTIKVSFHFISDSASNHTTRSTNIVDGLISGMNAIWTPQANVEFVKKVVDSPVVNTNLGSVVEWSATPSSNEWNIVTATGDSGADWNIFFVWKYEQDGTPATDDTDAGTLASNTIFEDDAGTEIAETLAHEAGHLLGISPSDYTNKQDELMHAYTDLRGCILRKSQVNQANP